MPVPVIRIRALNDAPVRREGECVLHWMTAFRRLDYNFSLQRAAEWARELRVPLVILEGLRCDYPWASDRLHTFVIQGMAEKARRLRDSRILYYPYLEPTPGAGRGLLGELARRSCVVVTDDFPAFFLPRMAAAAARQLPVSLEAVDANGLLPLRATDRTYPTAYAFRRFLQRHLPEHLPDFPTAHPLSGSPLPLPPGLPSRIVRRWPMAGEEALADPGGFLAGLPVDHQVLPVEARGGSGAAEAALRRFLRRRLSRYATERNEPEREITSALSPYLHFGNISVHQVFAELARQEHWSPAALSPSATGQRQGWWGMSTAAEAFLDQLVTWRELGLNMCCWRGDAHRFGSLPDWARQTLEDHATDPRPHVYTLRQLDGARTHDELWNAAQRQLVREGRMHNYLRMLWGKKILEWSASPRRALQVMLKLNDKYALDGRDPNSLSGIFWVLGRYDRPWGPERPIFGKVRYMSSANTARKFRLEGYLRRYGPRKAS
jgi:deoxyribodipyrimidine photo-lyase